MAKMYFLGGENVVRRDAESVNELAFEDAGGAPSVLVFPWARPSFDRTYVRRKRFRDYLRSLGASSVEFSEYSDPFSDIKSRTECADLIYFTGGQTSVLLSRLRKSGVDELLCSYRGVIVGRSAGALVLGKNCLVTSRHMGTSRVVPGLRLVDFSVKVHYKPDKDNLLKALSKTEKIYAIPQRAALVYDRDRDACSFLGEVFLFADGQKSRVH
jgi:peptidase E